MKANKQKQTYEKNKQTYTGNTADLFDEVFSKEVGFNDFQKVNENFEYRIIFDASLQKQQQKLFETIQKI